MMKPNNPKADLKSIESARVLSARLVVAHCLERQRNEWVNWSGDTHNIRRPVGWAYPNRDVAQNEAESYRAPGTVLAIEETVAIELTCDKGLVIAFHRFTDSPFYGTVESLEKLQDINSIKMFENALKNKQQIYFNLYLGEGIPNFINYTPDAVLFKCNARNSGKGNRLGWACKPYEIHISHAQRIVDLLNASTRAEHLTSNKLDQTRAPTANLENHEAKIAHSSNRLAEDKERQQVEIDKSLELATPHPLVEEPPSPPTSPVDETEREQVTKVRVGQDIFRKRVEEIERCCRLTGLSNMAHLRASHIKPWRVCSDEEKLDGNNGLLLSPHIDHLFDQGYISFSDSGDLLVSKTLCTSVLATWKIDSKMNVGSFNQNQRFYLAYHRSNIFKA